MSKALIALALGLALATSAAAETKQVTVTREENKPATVEVKAGDSVAWKNATGGTAHISFGGNDAIRFYVGTGDSRVRFDKPGTYEYATHISGVKAHAHTGTVVVK